MDDLNALEPPSPVSISPQRSDDRSSRSAIPKRNSHFFCSHLTDPSFLFQTWFERNRPPPRPQDVIHAEAVMDKITDIGEEVVYIHQQINDVLRDPNLDMLRQAASRIDFALRQLKWNFEHYAALHDHIKTKVATIEARLDVLERGAVANAGAASGSGSGSGSGGAAATAAGAAIVAESVTDSSTDAGMDTPSATNSSSSSSGSPTVFGTPTGGSPIGYATFADRQDSPTGSSDSDTPVSFPHSTPTC